MTFQPTGDNILVKVDEAPKQTPGGIVLPDDARRNSTQRGTVIAVGPGVRNEEGVCHPLEIKDGDRILFRDFSGVDIELGDEKLVALQEGQVIAIIKE